MIERYLRRFPLVLIFAFLAAGCGEEAKPKPDGSGGNGVAPMPAKPPKNMSAKA